MLKKERCKIVKILVLGNGFDLDHGLPTSYSDFLNFCNAVLGMDATKNEFELKPSQEKYIVELKEDEALKAKFLELLKNNHLLAYFNAQIKKSGENWIDLEREIKGIINEFRIITSELNKSNQLTYPLCKDHKINVLLKELNLSGLGGKELNAIKLSIIHRELCIGLDRFSQALELYIYHFVNQTKVEGISPDIIDFAADKVLTFNYSNTYERIYGGIRWNQDVDYIHGFAKPIEDNRSGIILGVTSKEELTKNGYVEFEKYFQRITKCTGSNYAKWLASKATKHTKKEIVFFGHSLDSTDGDVILDLVSDETTSVTIYYHDNKAYQQIVANLIEIIGKEHLISYVYGEHPKIRFVAQQKHRQENTAGLEITRDIRSLYSLYLLSNDEITELISKIKSKVKSKDLSYFYSQQKVISMFEALCFHNITSKRIDKYVEICAMLDYEVSSKGKLKYYDSQEWYGFEPWGEEIPCDRQTSKLISEVNKNNKLRYEESKIKLPYYHIKQMESSTEIKDALLVAFSEKHPTQQYLSELYDLISDMAENNLLEEALDLIGKEKLPIEVRAKYKNFYTSYWETVNNIRYNRQLMEEYEERKQWSQDEDF